MLDKASVACGKVLLFASFVVQNAQAPLAFYTLKVVVCNQFTAGMDTIDILSCSVALDRLPYLLPADLIMFAR